MNRTAKMYVRLISPCLSLMKGVEGSTPRNTPSNTAGIPPYAW